MKIQSINSPTKKNDSKPSSPLRKDKMFRPKLEKPEILIPPKKPAVPIFSSEKRIKKVLENHVETDLPKRKDPVPIFSKKSAEFGGFKSPPSIYLKANFEEAYNTNDCR